MFSVDPKTRAAILLARRGGTPPKLSPIANVPRAMTRVNSGLVPAPGELGTRINATWHPPPDRTPRPPKPKGPVPRPQGKPIGWYPPDGPRKPKPKGV